MDSAPADGNSVVTVASVAVAAVVGSFAASTRWVDAKTGKFSPLLMISGIALCLIFGSAVHWVGVEKGIDQWTQIVITALGSYIGPDPIIRAVFSTLSKRYGVNVDADADTKSSPKP